MDDFKDEECKEWKFSVMENVKRNKKKKWEVWNGKLQKLCT